MKTATRIALFTALCTLRAAAADLPVEIGFNKSIRPLLSEHCFACHGPDSASRQADLRLDKRADAVASGALLPGNAAESELIRRIMSDDPDVMMPPPQSQKRPGREEQELLARWIEAGANWEEHWAFVKPQRGVLPRPAGVGTWARNPIDHYLLERLRQIGLRPNPQADRYTLARRAALDITGLPPDRSMLNEFLADTGDGSYGRYVAALLSSERAGEHRARYWLDAARYGDTHGMHVDNYREIWPYRDWVIRAFNANMPFDQFVIEQLAGDLLGNPTLDQRIATGFNRCNITTSEGGAIPAELDVRYMVDRVETTATVFLALTAGCAVCHDHKYDPITQREFYQLGAFFNNTTQPAMDGNQKDTPPVVTLPDEQFLDEWEQLQARRAALRGELNGGHSAVRTWWPGRPREIVHPLAADNLALYLPLAEGEPATVFAPGPDPAADSAPVTESVSLPVNARWEDEHPAGKRGIRFGSGSDLSFALPRLRSDEPLTVSFWFRTPDQVMSATLFDHTAQTADKKTLGWRITSSTQGGISFELFDAGGKQIRGLLPDNEALAPRAWQHVCVRYSGGQSNSSVSILVNGRAGALRNSSEAYVEATDLADGPLRVASNLATAGLSDIRIFRRWLSDDETLLLADEFALKHLLQSERRFAALTAAERARLSRFHCQVVDREYRQRSRELSDTERRRDFIYARSTTTLVMQERPSAPRAWVLARGEYTNPGDEVAPAVPAVLPPLPAAAPRNRLGLARWLVHPDHPLTARVMMNRLWQSVFGVGLVKTSEDFGVMGDRPTHPELLDWLASEFVDSGWDLNHMLRLIVTSAAYRQDSLVSAEKLRQDPDNRYLSRGPRIRLDAEMLRDQALAVGQLLQRQIGGPSVKPYQPAGLWNVVAITGSNTRVYQKDSGNALYRRSVYTFWKRTSPPPSMAAFNAPTREQCTVRRERTNTPLQALILMNDPQYVEAARHLAEYTLTQRSNDRDRAAWMWSTALCRPAEPAEIAELAATAAEFRAHFRERPAAAEELMGIGDSPAADSLEPSELAAWTMVANTLMNRDDFLNK